MAVVSTSSINLALVKYWGKADDVKMLPLNDSLSVTLQNSEVVTNCELTLMPLSNGHTFVVNGIENNSDKRILKMLEKAKDLCRLKNHGSCVLDSHSVSVNSSNTFPTDAGMASSASGCSAVALCLAELCGLSRSDASVIARTGSGSACRSVYGGFVRWSAETGLSSQLHSRNHWSELKVVMLIHSEVPKQISSRDGMAVSVATSELMRGRVECASRRVELMQQFIKQRDFSSVATLTMQESNQLHAICLDTWPPLVYLNSTSFHIMRFVHLLNDAAKKIIAAYTFDAGPNGFILVEDHNLPLLMAGLEACFEMPSHLQGDLKESTLNICSSLVGHFKTKDKINRVVIADIAADPEVSSVNTN